MLPGLSIQEWLPPRGLRTGLPIESVRGLPNHTLERQRSLTETPLSDIVSYMKPISIRSLVREFPKARTAARKGQPVEIHDGKTGETFILTAKPTRTFGELAASAKGACSGPRDLSSREGFDA